MIENTYSEIENYAQGIRKTEVLATDKSLETCFDGSDQRWRKTSNSDGERRWNDEVHS